MIVPMTGTDKPLRSMSFVAVASAASDGTAARNPPAGLWIKQDRHTGMVAAADDWDTSLIRCMEM